MSWERAFLERCLNVSIGLNQTRDVTGASVRGLFAINT